MKVYGPIWFLGEMQLKLQENSHKEGWINLHYPYLLRRIGGELAELRRAIKKGDEEEIIREAADVANFAMMIADIARHKYP